VGKPPKVQVRAAQAKQGTAATSQPRPTRQPQPAPFTP
jgi:hypothetical protein